MIRLMLAGATVLLVGGCSLAPDFIEPETRMPEELKLGKTRGKGRNPN